MKTEPVFNPNGTMLFLMNMRPRGMDSTHLFVKNVCPLENQFWCLFFYWSIVFLGKFRKSGNIYFDRVDAVIKKITIQPLLVTVNPIRC